VLNAKRSGGYDDDAGHEISTWQLIPKTFYSPPVEENLQGP
jgi:hypothetical protein